jgi:hypothetical protein
MHVFLNDQFIEAENASLHISDLAIQRGYGIFDFFRVRNNVPLYVEDHLDRYSSIGLYYAVVFTLYKRQTAYPHKRSHKKE